MRLSQPFIRFAIWLPALVLLASLLGCAKEAAYEGGAPASPSPILAASAAAAGEDSRAPAPPSSFSEAAGSADTPPSAPPSGAKSAEAPPAAAPATPQAAASAAPSSSATPNLASGGASEPSAPPASPSEPSAPPVSAPASSAAASADERPTATLSIAGDEKSGVILAATAVALEPNDTVLDVLKRTTRNNKIQMEFSGRGAYAYIEGINNLYEFDDGAESGWMYRVNGEFPDKSAGAYKLKDGDVVEWLYTLNLGEDIGATPVKR